MKNPGSRFGSRRCRNGDWVRRVSEVDQRPNRGSAPRPEGDAFVVWALDWPARNLVHRIRTTELWSLERRLSFSRVRVGEARSFSHSAWTEGPNMDSLVFGNGAARQSIPEKQTAGTGEMRKELEK